MITLCRVPWYLFPGLPRPTISQGVYSTLTPLSLSGKEARTESLVGTRRFVKRGGKWALLELENKQTLWTDAACNIETYTGEKKTREESCRFVEFLRAKWEEQKKGKSKLEREEDKRQNLRVNWKVWLSWFRAEAAVDEEEEEHTLASCSEGNFEIFSWEPERKKESVFG